MSLRLEMLQVARLAPRLLGDAADLVADFLAGQMNDDGGFKDRAGDSDLYYTVFGVEALLALRRDVPFASVAAYLNRQPVESLDFVHAACLARGWAALPPALRDDVPKSAILRHIETFRCVDSAYSGTAGAERGTLYGCFLALGAYQDLAEPLPDPEAMVRCIQSLRTTDGGYANGDDLPIGLTPPTAAAATLLRHLGRTPPPELESWLLSRCRPEGGFFASPVAPLPDLLSTATALHALSGLQADLAPVRDPCLDFLDTLWTNRGGFYGTWEDDTLDCEYTYYALLALGHLAV